MSLKAKNRYQAFAVHLLLSLLIVSTVVFLIFYLWYPEPFFTVDGGWSVLRMIILVDLVLGPALMLVVYKPGKKGLKFDMATIVTVQIAALLYGTNVLYDERPVFMVFSVDRFVVVSADDIDYGKLRYPELKEKPTTGPIPVYAQLPTDPNERLRFNQEVMQGKPDLEYRSEYYVPYLPNLDKVLSKRKAKETLLTKSEYYKNNLNSFEQQHCAAGCAYYPLVGKKKDMLIAISQRDGHVVGAVDLDPWV